MARSNEGEEAKHFSLLDQGNDIILKSTPDGLFTIDRALKAGKHSTILASVFVYASSLTIFLVLLFFELRKATVVNDVRVVKAPESLVIDGYTCEGLKQNSDLKVFKNLEGIGIMSANIDYSTTTEKCFSAISNDPCKNLLNYQPERERAFDMICDTSAVASSIYSKRNQWQPNDGKFFPNMTYNCPDIGNFGIPERNCSTNYMDTIRTLAAVAKCPGLTIDLATGSQKFSDFYQMTAITKNSTVSGGVDYDLRLQWDTEQIIHIKEYGFNGISMYIPRNHLADYDVMKNCREGLRAVCEEATALSAPFSCTKNISTYPTFFEAFGVAYPNTLAYISVMFILLSIVLPILRPPSADKKEGVEFEQKTTIERGYGVSDTSATGFPFEVTEVYENPLAARDPTAQPQFRSRKF